MTGLLGAGIRLPLFSTPLFLNAEVLAGAAGGGGLNLGGGLIEQMNGGLGYQLNNDLGLIAQYGYMSAIQGPFRAKTVSLSLAYNFTLFTK